MDVIGHRSKALQFRREIERAVLPTVEERLDPQQVPGSEELLTVRNDKREDRVAQIPEHVAAVLAIQPQQQSLFAERPVRDAVLGSQLRPIAHLPVVTDAQITFLRAGEGDGGCLLLRNQIGIRVILGE